MVHEYILIKLLTTTTTTKTCLYKWKKESCSKAENDPFNNLKNKGGNVKDPATQLENSCLKQQANIIIYCFKNSLKVFHFINLFIYLFIYLFLAALGLRCCTQAFL